MEKGISYFSLAVACLMVGLLFGYRAGWSDGQAANVCHCRVDQHDSGQHDHDQGGNGKPLPIRPISPNPLGSPVGAPGK